MEVHGPSRRHDMRHVRKPCKRCGSESISSEESHLLPEQKETTAIAETDLDEDALRAAISATGYEVGEIRKEPWEKKGLFSW